MLEIPNDNSDPGTKSLQRSDVGTQAIVALPSGGEVLGYTRLRIVYTSCGGPQLRRYSEESRTPIERFFVGKIDNHVLKFDAVIEPIGVKASSKLYSMLRNSKKDGQTWTTAIRNNDFLLPYFRVDRSSVLNFSANFQSEGASEFNIGSAILDIVDRGSKFITPSTLLITDANKARFNDAASFVDDSLSKLFYKKVDETARQGIPILPSDQEKTLARIVLIAPNPIKTYITAQVPGRIIGQWEVKADPLTKSLFAPVIGDVADVSKLDPATVLNLKIDDEVVLRDRLASSEAIDKAAKLMAKASTEQVGEPATSFCRLVAAEAAKVGLAPHDMAIAAWAYLADQAMERAKQKAANSACDVVRYFPTTE